MLIISNQLKTKTLYKLAKMIKYAYLASALKVAINSTR